MALERSVLNHEVIAKLLREHYCINAISSKKLKLGSANCYKVYDGDKFYFLKEFQNRFKAEDLVREYDLTEFLAIHGFPVARFVRTLSGLSYIIYKDHIICIEEYIDGLAYGYDNFPSSLLSQSAMTLGKLHSVLRDYPLPSGMDEEWIASYSADSYIKKYDELQTVADLCPEDKNYARITEDLTYKKGLAYRCDEYRKFYTGITYVSTHGDYQGCQLICSESSIKAVIDFSSARRLPAVWELMRSYVQSCEDCRVGSKINIQKLCEYVAEYMKCFPLTKADLRSMPYVYLFQLARSQFGYPQYLSGDSEDREGLLKFAFWRTDMCRELEHNAETISQELIKLTRFS